MASIWLSVSRVSSDGGGRKFVDKAADVPEIFSAPSPD
jgi:hypothetical protein